MEAGSARAREQGFADNQRRKDFPGLDGSIAGAVSGQTVRVPD